MSLLHSGSTASDSKLYPEDVFSTYLYTGNSSTQTINNGIDLSTYGGMVWIKKRNGTNNNDLFDTNRGALTFLRSDSTTNQLTVSNSLSSFNNNGFTVLGHQDTNFSSGSYASWTFRKAPKFFDVVTWTGNGVAGRKIQHSLGSAPGCIIAKNITSATDWAVYHRNTGLTNQARIGLSINTTGASGGNAAVITSTTEFTPDDDFWTSAANNDFNVSGQTYVAYLFAHDPSADGIIQCGSTVSDASRNVVVNLGWEPQFILFKRSDSIGDWKVVDNIRGLLAAKVATDQSATPLLVANTSAAEVAGGEAVGIEATGFRRGQLDVAGATYIYIAIRRPMKTPTSGTEVFKPVAYTGDSVANRVINNGFITDLSLITQRNANVSFNVFDRLRGYIKLLMTPYTFAEQDTSEGYYVTGFDNNVGVKLGVNPLNQSTSPYIEYAFKRAPGFFDVVCYTGDGASLSHNLGVTPEFIIAKARGTTGSWRVTSSATTGVLYLDATDAKNGTASFQTLTPCTATTMNLSGISQNTTNVAYLFATLAGISKVGSYIGNGSNQTINCGFTTGARFILIKRTDSTGDWYVWDSVRGIVAANDPHLSLNSTAAEVTTDDSIDPAVEGFVCNQNTTTNINVLNATYIFLAVS